MQKAKAFMSIPHSASGCVARVMSIVAGLIIVCGFDGCARNAVPPKASPPQVSVNTAAESLSLGSVVAKNISGHALHAYLVVLSAGQQVRIVLDKGDLRLQLLVNGPANKTSIRVDSWRAGALTVPVTAEVSGVYQLEIRGLENDATSRDYRLEITAVDSPRAKHGSAVLAAQRLAEAEVLRVKWDSPSLHSAIEKYKEASRLWQAAGESDNAADATGNAGAIYYLLGDFHDSLLEFKTALDLSNSSGNNLSIINSLNNVGYAYIYNGENLTAERHIERALALMGSAQSAGQDNALKRAEARALNNLAEIDYSLGNLTKSVALLQRSLALWKEVGGDRRGEALAYLNIGYALTDQGDQFKAEESYQQALTLWQSVDDRVGIALTQIALGNIYSLQGKEELALDFHKRAIEPLRAIGNLQGEAAALNGVAAVYENLNDYQTALVNYEQALQIYQKLGNQDFIALGRYLIGRVHSALGDLTRALSYLRESERMSRLTGQRIIEARVLMDLGSIYRRMGKDDEALRLFTASLRLSNQAGTRRRQVDALNNIGHIYAEQGLRQKAVEYFRKSLALTQEIRDQRAEASLLFNISSLDRDDGEIQQALAEIEKSIEIIESLRVAVTATELRDADFVSIHKHYELYIDLLMRLHQLRPDEGFNVKALLASERARARALLESLLEENSPLYRGNDQVLFQREQELRKLILAKSAIQMRELSHTGSDHRSAELETELAALKSEYQMVQAEISEKDPRYAYLTQPARFRVTDIQRELVDENTVLLEFSLGDEKSYLWAVTGTNVKSFELPRREIIENSIKQVYALLTARESVSGETREQYSARVAEADTKYWSSALELSQMLLGQVAGELGTKRLLIVSDGSLQYLPFEALPAPVEQTSSAPQLLNPLLVKHEVAGMPSAMMLVTLRRLPEQSAPKTIAVFADPVFGIDDPRLDRLRGSDASTKKREQIEISPNDAGRLERLPHTLDEARAIVSLLPVNDSLLATGFDATRERALSDELNKYRIIHFATHAVFNNEHPELSGVVLSTIDNYGNFQDGYLRLNDIYGLRLPADLVVLSGCRTAGAIVQGKGLAGLTNGFMQAGSKTVVASLWRVDDRATAELMTRFYQGLLKDGTPPASALRQAQLAMWNKEQWHAPYYWAAFGLQGEYKDHFGPSSVGSTWSKTFWIAILVVLLGSGAYALFHMRANRRRA
jgi:CHAT domain-containing protein/Flp pilus assembly protein TadD